MRMSEQEFFDCTPRYFMLRRRGWLENRQGYEQARFLAFYMLKTVDSKNKIKRLTNVCKFPWEKSTNNWEAWDQEKMDAFSDEADEALKALNPEAYARYMEGKRARAAADQMFSEAAADMDAEFRIEEDLNL